MSQDLQQAKQKKKSSRSKKRSTDTVYLFGYGSLNVPMVESLIGKKLKHEPLPAYLPNHVRIFSGHSGYWNGAVASVHPMEGRKVYGSLITLQRGDLQALDDYEGDWYSRVKRVVVVGNNKEKKMVYVYIKNDTTFESMPSIRYINSIKTNLKRVGNDRKDRIPINLVLEVDGKQRVVEVQMPIYKKDQRDSPLSLT